MKHIMFCPKCRAYTLMDACRSCSSQAVLPKPAKYSPEDPYADYRRRAKEPQLSERGWL